MLVTLLGMVIVVRPEHFQNADLPIATTLSGMTEFLHPATNVFVAVSITALQSFLESYFVLFASTRIDSNPKTELISPQTEETLAPIIMFSIEVASPNQRYIKLQSDLLMVIEVKLRPSNAKSPTEVTELGIVKEANDVHLLKAP